MTKSKRPEGAYEHPINITWGDCDPARIVYSGRIPWFALDAINGWWEHKLDGMGWFQMEMDRNFGTPFVHMSLDFFHPITPRHPLICAVWPEKLGDKSITFRVEGSQDGTLCFTGKFVNVFIESSSFTSRVPPEDIRALVMAHLPTDDA